MVERIALVVGWIVGGAGLGVAQDLPPASAPTRIAEPRAAPPHDAKATSAYVEMYDVRDLALPAAVRRLVTAWTPEVRPDAGKDDERSHRFVATNPAAVLDDFFARRTRRGDGESSDADSWNLVGALIRRVCLREGRDVEECRVVETGALVLKATREQHATVDRLLHELRASADGVQVEVRVLELDESAQQRLASFAAARGVDGTPAPTQALTPTANELEDLLADPGTTVVAVPKVTVFQLDEFEVEIVDQFSYIANFELTAIEGMGTIADPIIKQVKQGVSVHGRCVAAAAPAGETATPYALRL